MARLARVESFAGDEVAVVHVMNRVVRRCFLLGDDAVTGKNFDHRKFEEFISRQQVRGTRLPQRITVGVCISAGNRQHVQQVVIRRGSSPTVQQLVLRRSNRFATKGCTRRSRHEPGRVR